MSEMLDGVFNHEPGCRAPDYAECTCISLLRARVVELEAERKMTIHVGISDLQEKTEKERDSMRESLRLAINRILELEAQWSQSSLGQMKQERDAAIQRAERAEEASKAHRDALRQIYTEVDPVGEENIKACEMQKVVIECIRGGLQAYNERDSILAVLPDNATCKFEETGESIADNVRATGADPLET